MSNAPTPESGSVFRYSFLINYLGGRNAHRFWYEGCLYSRCEKDSQQGSRASELQRLERVKSDVNDQLTHLIGAAGRVGLRGMKTERRRQNVNPDA